MTNTIDDTICPLCQSSNHCGVNDDAPCWCNEVKIPPKLIAQVPEQLQKKSCICQKCAEKFQKLKIKEVT